MIPALLVPSVRPIASLRGNAYGFQGQTAQLTLRQYLIGGGYSDNSGVSWSSSNPNVASVNGSGLVTINAVSGTCTITATAGGRSYAVGAGSFISGYNALGNAAAGTGRTIQVGWVAGVNATIAGGKSTQLLNVVNPGDGNHLRPSPGNPGGATVNGSNNLISKGLYCPGTAPYFANPGIRDDTTLLSSTTHVVPNSLFTDRGAGVSVDSIAKIRVGSWTWRWGPQGGADTQGFGGDTLNGQSFYALKATNAAFGGPLTLGQGSVMVAAETSIVHMQDAANYASLGGVADGNFMWHRYGRDLIQDLGNASITGNLTSGGRDFFVLENNNGFDPDADTEWVANFVGAGRSNSAQTKFLGDFAEARYGAYVDPRADLGWIFGDSEQSPMRSPDNNTGSDGLDHIAHIMNGFRGRPAIDGFALCLMARAGNTPYAFQAPMLRWLEDCDFSKRSHLVSMQSEYNNGGTPTDNYAWAADAKRVLGPKGKVVGYDTTYDTAVTKAANEPGYYNELVAHGLEHFDYFIHLHDGLEYDVYNWGLGVGPGYPIWWASEHPISPDTQEYREAPIFSGLMLGLGRGASLTNQSMKVDPSVVHKDFVYADPAFTPTWTAKRWDTVVLAGKTYAFSTRNSGIATVNASTGVITPGSSNGQTGVDCWSNDGAKGTIVINLSGAPVLLHSFTSADSATTVPSADTGQATIVQNDGVWGTIGNQLYRATPGVGPHIDKVVWDAAQASGTFSSVLATLANQMCIVYRDSGQDDFFLMSVNTGAGTLAVFRQQAGVGTQIDHGIGGLTWANGDVLGVILSGNTHQPTKNGVVLDTITDAFNNTATKFGAGMIGGGAGARWDTIKLV